MPVSAIKDKVDEISRCGYAVLPGLFSQEDIARMRERILFWHAQSAVQDETVPFLNVGHDVVYNLQNKDVGIVKALFSNPTIRGISIGLLNDQWYRAIPENEPNYILRATAARSSGQKAMPLHIDSFVPGSGKLTWSMQVAIVLDDQTEDNGCTIVVPESHLFDRYATQDLHSVAKPITSKAGDVVVWDSRLWHGARQNVAGTSRWSIIATFTRWWLKQNYDITRHLPQSIYEQLDPSERAIMGYCSIPPRDESDRIDMKSGYDVLKPTVAEYFS